MGTIKLVETYFPCFEKCTRVTLEIVEVIGKKKRPIIGETVSIADYFEVKKCYDEKLERLKQKAG